MIDMWNRRLKPALCITVALAAGAVVATGDFAIDFWTLDGGGEVLCTGGTFELSGTIGQPDAPATALVGGNFRLTGGFWLGAGTCFGDLDGDGHIDSSDLAILLANYGTTSGATYADGDIYPAGGDGMVNMSDLGELLPIHRTSCE
jgi:hypothetical protein